MLKVITPTPFFFQAQGNDRFSITDDYAAHLWVIANQNNERGVLLVHSISHDNVSAPGGGINRGETVLEGLRRELQEEAPPLLNVIDSAQTVAMWRQSKRGVYNTFLLEAPSNFDIWEARRIGLEIIEQERAGPARPDYLETDGGIVWVPLKEIEEKIRDSSVVLKCYTGKDTYIMLKLRPPVVPMFAELTRLVDLNDECSNDNHKRRAFDRVSTSHRYLVNNQWISYMGCNFSIKCVSCGLNIRDPRTFEKISMQQSTNVNFCDKCNGPNAYAYSKALLKTLFSSSEKSWLVADMACDPFKHFVDWHLKSQ